MQDGSKFECPLCAFACEMKEVVGADDARHIEQCVEFGDYWSAEGQCPSCGREMDVVVEMYHCGHVPYGEMSIDAIQTDADQAYLVWKSGGPAAP